MGDRFLRLKFSEQGTAFPKIFPDMGVWQKLAKIGKKGSFLPMFTVRVGTTASFGNWLPVAF